MMFNYYKFWLALKVYNGLFYLATPAIIARLWWRGRTSPAYRQRLAERFCKHKAFDDYPEIDIWLHAVSLGEVNAALPLIQKLVEQKCCVLITTTTPTGSKQVQKKLANHVYHQYLPYDLPRIMRRFLTKINPKVIVIMETELWPNLIVTAKCLSIPLIVINGRISVNACKHYSYAKWFFKPLLAQIRDIYTQTLTDAQRFQALSSKARVTVIGNIKLDAPKAVFDESFLTFKRAWGSARTVILLASTHELEEAMLLKQLRLLNETIENWLVLIAPRHPERFDKVYRLSQNLGFNTGRRSDNINLDNQVIIVDSLGELNQFYHLADYAFIGGSLVKIGGHNIIEAMQQNVPVFCGPYVDNIKTLCNQLVEAKAIILADNAREIIRKIIYMHYHKKEKQQQIDNAQAFLAANQGSLIRYLAIIRKFLD